MIDSYTGVRFSIIGVYTPLRAQLITGLRGELPVSKDRYSSIFRTQSNRRHDGRPDGCIKRTHMA